MKNTKQSILDQGTDSAVGRRILDRLRIITDYEAAYLAANKKPVTVRFDRGWFYLSESLSHLLDTKRFHRAQIVKMTNRLMERIAERDAVVAPQTAVTPITAHLYYAIRPMATQGWELVGRPPLLYEETFTNVPTMRVALLDVSNPEQLVAQVARAIYDQRVKDKSLNIGAAYPIVETDHMLYEPEARAVLTSLGI